MWRLAWIAMAGLLWIAPAIAQTTFTPRDESPEEFAAGTGRDETFYACTACHGFKLVAQQGMTRAQWEDSINLMVRRHNMPPLDDKDRDIGAELSRGGLSAARANGQGRLGEPVCQVTCHQVNCYQVNCLPARSVPGLSARNLHARFGRCAESASRCDRPAQPAGCASSHPLPRVEFSRPPRREAYSLPSIGATCGGSLSRYGRPIPYSLPCASIHFQKLSVETHRCARVAPLTLTTSAASPWP